MNLTKIFKHARNKQICTKMEEGRERIYFLTPSYIIEHVTLVTISATTILLSHLKVKSLWSIWRSGTYRCKVRCMILKKIQWFDKDERVPGQWSLQWPPGDTDWPVLGVADFGKQISKMYACTLGIIQLKCDFWQMYINPDWSSFSWNISFTSSCSILYR